LNAPSLRGWNELRALQTWVIILELLAKPRWCGAAMLTRRAFHIGTLSLGASVFSVTVRGQPADAITIRIRLDDSVRQSIPPLVQRNLIIEPDQSDEAKELVRRSPPSRAVPIIFIVVGAMSIPLIVQMMREALRQVYYGGVLIDMRKQPVTVTSDPQIPANMIFMIDAEGKTTRFTSDQLSPELLISFFKAK
jgi:hypothetical protein